MESPEECFILPYEILGLIFQRNLPIYWLLNCRRVSKTLNSIILEHPQIKDFFAKNAYNLHFLKSLKHYRTVHSIKSKTLERSYNCQFAKLLKQVKFYRGNGKKELVAYVRSITHDTIIYSSYLYKKCELCETAKRDFVFRIDASIEYEKKVKYAIQLTVCTVCMRKGDVK